MSLAVLIHDDGCGRAYVYVDGALVLDADTSDPVCREQIARALEGVDAAMEAEGTVPTREDAPETLDGWTGLEPVEREGDDSLRAIIAAFAVGVVAVWIFNAEYIFGEDIFWPGGGVGP